MNETPKRTIGWIGVAALGFGGANLTLYTLSSLISTQGTIVIPIFIFALILTYFSSFGYIELVLMYPKKVGGIAPACAEVFKTFSPILTTIIGVGYWLAWLLAASFASLYMSGLIQQYLPWVSVAWLSTLMIASVVAMSLCGLGVTQRFAIPVAAMAALMCVLTMLIPILFGEVSWNQSIEHTLIAPFPGEFGQITSLMAALYIIGWLAPGYETTLCYVGETIDPEKNIKRAMFVSMFAAGLFYGLAPTIWMDVIGPEAMAKDFAQSLSPVYAPLLGEFAYIGIAWFLIFNMLICLFAPIAGPSRTLAQLAKDGLIPEFFAMTSRVGAPWVAILLTGMISTLIIWVGAPTWLIAATNFQYLLCISLASVAVWLLRHIAPDAPRLYRAPTLFIYLGLFAAFCWLVATILGFRQYGLSTMIIGISFSFIGVPLYFWRKTADHLKNKLPLISPSLHLKLTGTMLTVLIIDALGYLIAIHSIADTNTIYVAILEDIFVVVALLTLTVGLVVPGMIVNAAEEVNLAARRIIQTNLRELSKGMEELGSGNLSEYRINSDITPISIRSRDEIGEMAKSFNLMQEEIQKTTGSMNEVRERLRQAIMELTELNTTLEKRVEDRTAMLKASNNNLKNEISERIKAQSKISALHNELIVAARRAGMADIATSTLHNIGNVLTSVNTTTAIVRARIAQSQVDNLSKIADLFNQHEDELVEFLTKDQNGKLIPGYIVALAVSWSNEKKYLIEEMNSLKKNIDHINNIISMQQTLSKTIGVTEETSMSEVINDALALNKLAFERADVEIACDFQPIQTVVIDRVKVLQIIVNLIKNGIDSLVESKQKHKKLYIHLEPVDNESFQVKIVDNGLGIKDENITKIFSSGFTTKKAGHGFGLHSSSLAAKEMGGSLNATSDGEGKGATFTLTLPYKIHS